MRIAPRLWALRLLALCVPRARREEWLREWESELLSRELGRGGGRRTFRRLGTLVLSLGAMEDAVAIWWRSSGRPSWIQHFRFALRGLRREPTFAGVAVVTLILGIGANVAMYSVVHSVMLRPLPYEDPGTLIDARLSFRNLETARERPIPASEPEFLELRDELSGLALAGYWTSDVNLGGGAEPDRVPAAYVSADFLELLGVTPRLGRSFGAGEDVPGAEPVAVISYGLWLRSFGADPGAVGAETRLDGRPVTIVGVLPEDFFFPGFAADVLRPNPIDPTQPAGRSSHYLSMIGRLAQGVELEAARQELIALQSRWEEEYPGRHGVGPTHPLTLIPLRDALVGETRSSLLILMGVVALVLLIASANVASLMLVRVEHRQRETGVRVALGAGARAVAAPFIAESVVLAALGALGGLLLAHAAIDVVELLGPDALTRLGGVRIDLPVFGFALAVSGGAALLFGAGPALAAVRSDVGARLRDGARSSAGPRRARHRDGLVVTEVALAAVLVIGSFLLLKSLSRLQRVEPGFDAEGVVTMQFSLSRGEHPEPSDVADFHEALARRLDAVPGVVAAGTIRALPFELVPGYESISPLDVPLPPDEYWNAQYQVAAPGTFAALGVPLLEGRAFERTDRDGAPVVAIVNRSMARAFWPDGSAVGARLKLGHPQGPTPEMTVVGVVDDVRQSGFGAPSSPQLFAPLGQVVQVYGGLGTRLTTLVVRSELDPTAAITSVREAIRELDPALPVVNMRSMRAVMAGSVADERFLAVLVATFSLLAVALGAVGVAGLVAYTVERRAREFGLRIALGAERWGIVRRVLAQAGGLAAAGALAGIGMAGVGARLLEGHLFEVGFTDPMAFTLGPVALVAVALLAAWIPATRATRIDPTRTMRAD